MTEAEDEGVVAAIARVLSDVDMVQNLWVFRCCLKRFSVCSVSHRRPDGCNKQCMLLFQVQSKKTAILCSGQGSEERFRKW